MLLPALPADLAAAVFVVLHLPRERPSLLVEIFQPQVRGDGASRREDKEPLEPGTVYFAPPDYHLLVDEGPQLALSADEPVIFPGRPSTCCSSRPPSVRRTPARHHPDRRQRGRRGGAGGGAPGGRMDVVQDPDDGACAAHGRGGAQAQPGGLRDAAR